MIALLPAVCLCSPFQGAHVGIHIADLKGQTLVEENSNQWFVPCSLVKLWTAVAALEKLGSNHQFKTQIWQGKGNSLVLTGEGDPLLRTADLQEMAKGLSADIVYANIEKFPLKHPSEAQIEDAVWYYGAPICGINFERNQVDLGLEDPLARTCPHLDAAQVVAQVVGAQVGCGGEKVTLLREHLSIPVIDLAKQMLAHSDNVIAALLYHHAPIDHPHIFDGVGFSVKTLVSPKEVTQLLIEHPELKQILPKFFGKVWAKTGHRQGYTSLAGYAETSQGKSVVFSILVNCHQASREEARKMINEMLLENLAKY